MEGEKGNEPQHAKPQDEMKDLADLGLRLLVVETVRSIEMDWHAAVGQMGAGGRSGKAANEHSHRFCLKHALPDDALP